MASAAGAAAVGCRSGWVWTTSAEQCSIAGVSPERLGGARIAPERSDRTDAALARQTGHPRCPREGKDHERTRKSVHLVLDVSGSMQGEPMARARDAARALVDKLDANDDFSLVTFSSGAEVAIDDGPVGPRRAAIKATIDGIREGGGTNIGKVLALGHGQAARPGIPAGAVKVAAEALGEPLFLKDAARLARLRGHTGTTAAWATRSCWRCCSRRRRGRTFTEGGARGTMARRRSTVRSEERT
jgi:hypothetical protein